MKPFQCWQSYDALKRECFGFIRVSNDFKCVSCAKENIGDQQEILTYYSCAICFGKWLISNCIDVVPYGQPIVSVWKEIELVF